MANHDDPHPRIQTRGRQNLSRNRTTRSPEAARRLSLTRPTSCICGRRRFRPPATKRSRGKAFFRLSKKKTERLRAENKRLQMERDILKKAAAFFAAEAR